VRLCIALFLVLALSSCGSVRIENATSLANAPEAVEYLLGTELNEGQRRAVGAIGIAVNAPLDYLSHNWLGYKDVITPTVTAADWQQDPVAAEKGVIFQAAKASAANQSWLSGLATWTNLIYTGISLIFGTGVAAGIKKVMNLKGALFDSLQFNEDALAVDPNDHVAVKVIKDKAIARKKGTSHEKTLDLAMNQMRKRQA